MYFSCQDIDIHITLAYQLTTRFLLILPSLSFLLLRDSFVEKSQTGWFDITVMFIYADIRLNQAIPMPFNLLFDE